MALNGIDVSRWQPASITADVDYDFVVVKATEGVDAVSPTCDAQYQAAVERGKLVGVYHFASGLGAKEEARFFADNIKGYIGQAVLVLDFEADALKRGAGWARTFLDEVFRLTKVRPLIYLQGSYASQKDYKKVVDGDYGLWRAAWGSNPGGGFENAPAEDLDSGVWPFTAIHQFTSNGRLEGYAGRLDLDVFYGSRDDWMKYAAPQGAEAAPAPDPVKASKPSAPAALPTSRYVVKAGETLSGIAAAHGMSWQDLYALNRVRVGGNPGLIHAGLTLELSGAAKAEKPKVTAPPATYRVQPGDTLSGIAGAHGTTWQELAKINGLANPNLIRAGETIKLKGKAPAPKTHTVKAGENLSGIAAKYGTTWQRLAQVNGISNPDVIYPGAKLTIK